MSAAEQLLPDLSEAVFETRVEEYCRWRRLLFHHETDSRRTRAGFLDLVIVGPGGHLFAELKTRTGRVRPDQQTWLDRLAEAGAEVHLWRPADWPAITARLDELARPRPIPPTFREET